MLEALAGGEADALPTQAARAAPWSGSVGE